MDTVGEGVAPLTSTGPHKASDEEVRESLERSLVENAEVWRRLARIDCEGLNGGIDDRD